jgi:hypothetical protein
MTGPIGVGVDHSGVDRDEVDRSSEGPPDRPLDLPEPPAGSRWRSTSPRALAVLAGLLYLPFVGLGYGTDIDITNIRRSGETILEGDYRYSRPPGAFPHEAITGVLDRLGGHTLVNVGSVVAAVVALATLAHLVERRHGPRAGRIAVAIAATQPWFWVAATSLGDYVYALAALLLGIDAAQRDRRLLAGIAFGTAVGFRSATALLVAAYLLAEVTGGSIDDDRRRDDTGRTERWPGVVTTAVVAGALGVAWFVPSWLSVGRTTRFLENQLRAGDVFVMVGRWGVKNVAFVGVFALLVLLVRLPVLVAAVGRFRELVLVRFAVYAAVVTELLYLRFPWKPVHLLPVAVCLSILVAVSPRTTNRFVVALVASQVVLAFVSVSVARPDVVDAATSGRLAPSVTRGVVLNDIDCRLDPPFQGTWPDLDTAAADYAAIRIFQCQARSWRAGVAGD